MYICSSGIFFRMAITCDHATKEAKHYMYLKYSGEKEGKEIETKK